MKKCLLLIICVTAVTLMLCINASADTVASGRRSAAGDNLTWELDDAGTLTIGGSGEMCDYPSVDAKPWVDVADRITSAVIGDGVTSIGAGAFDGCKNLADVAIGNDVTSIGKAAFRNCGIVNVIIPNGVTSIGDAAFQECKSLTAVGLPDGLESIGGTAFRGCRALKSVIIPSSVTKIGNSAFYGCKSLERIEIYSRNATFGSGVFSATYTDITIYGFAGSTAEEYADAKKHTFAPLEENSPETVYGDASGDGSADLEDIVQFARYIACWKDYGTDSLNLSVLDLNQDGQVNSIDLIILARHVADWKGYESLPYVPA